MTSYLLPCACGQEIAVTASQAGQAVQCSCGRTQEVPTLRGLHALPRAQSKGSAREATWGDRQRLAFICVLLALCAIGVAVYLKRNEPYRMEPPSSELVAEAFERGTPLDLQAALHYFEKGIDYVPPEIAVFDARVTETRHLMRWGMAIALSVALAGFGAAACALRSPVRG